MNRLFASLAALGCLGLVTSASANVIFSDADGVSSLYTETRFAPTDVYVEYGFNYGAGGRLTAPIGTPEGGGSETGILVAVNFQDDDGAFDAGINFFPDVPASGFYTLEFDVFAGVNSGGGTTEMINAGAHHSGTEVSIDAGDINARDGDWFEHTTEGGITNDFITFTANGGTQVAEDFLRNQFGVPNFLEVAMPSPPYPVVGAPGEVWTRYRVEATPLTTSFYINDVFIADIIGSDYTSGLPMFGYSDIFGSVAGGDSPLVVDGVSSFDPFAASFAIFDNITVTVPEPASALLMGLAVLGVAARRNG